ncbi:hypothetical protein [Streptomyces sp. NBC_01618]|uniref:hypothetical protein n=1 Tax=Streptomyces sp. NBC_01618 TaxID=2975900 RepID=UPI00386657D1|nr:hypothetical protein OH735_35620 [Streptomyces sp. NBC_01618]
MSATTHTAAAKVLDAEQAGRRIEEVLEQLTAAGDRKTSATAEELVRALMEFYGAGLARIIDGLLTAPGRDTGETLDALLGDGLVSSLLVLHDLHPEDTGMRIGRALEAVRDPVEVVSFDDSTGTLRLRTAGTGGCGCGGAPAAQLSVENSLACFAPEVTTVEMEPASTGREPALLQIGTRPPQGASTARPAPAGPS